MCLKLTFWDILGQFGRLFDEFGAFSLFSQLFPTIFTNYWLIEKRVMDRQMDGQTDGQIDPFIEMRGRI